MGLKGLPRGCGRGSWCTVEAARLGLSVTVAGGVRVRAGHVLIRLCDRRCCIIMGDFALNIMSVVTKLELLTLNSY